MAGVEGPRFSFDPDRCTVWTTFAEIKAGDRIDYEGPSLEVEHREDFPMSGLAGLVRVTLQNGRVLLLPPETGTYREPRTEEEAAA
ncbi:hypothetical protein JHN49_01125 [Streptomyces sp. MBT57]|nr:hypothetical protein [Streptomyces sp. MBT57]